MKTPAQVTTALTGMVANMAPGPFCDFLDNLLTCVPLSDKDLQVAWPIQVDLETRILGQPLKYREGTESGALDSVYKSFTFIRDQLQKNGSCAFTASLMQYVLNTVMRPFTAKWHPKNESGELRSNDGLRGQFRIELGELLKELEPIRKVLEEMTGLLPARAVAGKRATAPNVSHSAGLVSFEEIGGHFVGSLPPEVLMAEKTHWTARRDAAESNPTDKGGVAGLSFSGGGLRASALAVGLAQEFGRQGLFREFDYLSTVSGGSYAGALIAHHLYQEGKKAPGKPYVQNVYDVLGCPETEESEPVRNLRGRGNYLVNRGWWDYLSIAFTFAYGVYINLVGLFLAALMFAGIAVASSAWPSMNEGTRTVGCFLLLIAVLLLVLIYPPADRLRRKSGVRFLGKWSVLIGFGLIGISYFTTLVQRFHGLIQYWSELTVPEPGAGWTRPLLEFGPIHSPSIIVVIFGLLALVFAVIRAIAKPRLLKGLTQTVLVLSSAAFVVLLVLTVAALFYPASATFHISSGVFRIDLPFVRIASWINGLGLTNGVALSMIFGALLFYLHFCVNLNCSSLHYYYRKRLAQAYLGEKQDWRIPRISKLGEGVRSGVPIPIVNASVNLPAVSRAAELNGRRTSSFSFSPFYSGSLHTGKKERGHGYLKTRDWEKVDRGLNLASMVAISGAAVSPHMGILTQSTARFWMAVLNLRLNYWLANPERAWKRFLGVPGPGHLFKEILATDNGQGGFLNVSDGGHFENLGVYELLRRRVRYIVALDADGCGSNGFDRLFNLIRYARVDFGVEIEINISLLRANETGISKAHFVLGRIKYPAGKGGGSFETGWLVYLKASLTGNEPGDVTGYKARNEAFPAEPIINQIFSEEQFEAYRALGQHMARDLFAPEMDGMREWSNSASRRVEDWFRVMVENAYPDYEALVEDEKPRPGMAFAVFLDELRQEAQLASTNHG